MEQLDQISIDVSEHASNSLSVSVSQSPKRTGLILMLNTSSAFMLHQELSRQLAPIIAWRMHPLHQWARRKCGSGKR